MTYPDDLPERSWPGLSSRWLARLVVGLACCSSLTVQAAEPRIDFNREIRSILSNRCFICHGPDAAERQAGLRLDTREGAVAELDSGERAVVPGDPDASELIARVTTDDPSLRMPPAESGKQLTPREIEKLTAWIRQGAPYAEHWSYVKPVRAPVPLASGGRQSPVEISGKAASAAHQWTAWPRNPIDHFILDRLLREGLTPAPEADRHALIRRVSLDLTGLPPTLEEVDRFVGDDDPRAYEKLVDRLLDKQTYGEHWARKWLDLARYADSAGYADDPPRVIWAYRDWVIRAFNDNIPFDQFTVEQLAGDLLPDPTEAQLVATAFHRNTLTNNEGGTNDEEFRNVAVVDRVNTTLAVWMGTTIDCAQCHSHKYDPITQEEYFRLFAILNNSADADRRDESPFLEIWTPEQRQQKADWQSEIDRLERTLATPTPELAETQAVWERQFSSEPHWRALLPSSVSSREQAEFTIDDDGTIRVTSHGSGERKTDVDHVQIRIDEPLTLTALRLDVLPQATLPGNGPGFGGGNFVLSSLSATTRPPADSLPAGRYVRITLPGRDRFLSLAEVEVFHGQRNLARDGDATQSSTDYNGPPQLAIDGNTNGHYTQAKSTTHTAQENDPWWEVDLNSVQPVDRIVIWNRTDNNLHTRLAKFHVALLNERRKTVWERTVDEPPNPSVELSLTGARSQPFAAAFADFSQNGFDPADVLKNPDPTSKGWAVGGQTGRPHWLTLTLDEPAMLPAGAELTITLEQLSKHDQHTLGAYRLSVTDSNRAALFAQTPEDVRALIRVPAGDRTTEQSEQLAQYYLGIAAELQPQRDRLAQVRKLLAEAKPHTTVPVMRELEESQRRTTRIQHRGNFLDLGDVVEPGVPAVFHALPDGAVTDRLALARWLMDEDNPLTARVIANRYWEAIFGIGIVSTSEEFGSQGELPTHPELLDWLATELVRLDWDTKAFLKLLVTSAAYRQSSRVSEELYERDPNNTLLARGPRVRHTAEMIRDQALFVSGLLSPRMYGPPVWPPQPSLGLNAAFGSGIDWQTSEGEDRYRRGLYTTWRRSNPYPSMATFDAPNRETCTVRRPRTNTPLQALVTLNDPVYVEAAQALARRIVASAAGMEERLRLGVRLCLSRPPSDKELDQLVALYAQAREQLAAVPDQAARLAADPLGPAPDGADVIELAAWTVVGNVLLNLDEMFLKR